MADLSLAEERLSACGAVGLGFGSAHAGPLPDAGSSAAASGDTGGGGQNTCPTSGTSNGSTGAAHGGGVVAPAECVDDASTTGGADAVEPKVVLSKELVRALLARLRFRRHLHQVGRQAAPHPSQVPACAGSVATVPRIRAVTQILSRFHNDPCNAWYLYRLKYDARCGPIWACNGGWDNASVQCPGWVSSYCRAGVDSIRGQDSTRHGCDALTRDCSHSRA